MSAHPPGFDGGTVYQARMALDVVAPGYMTLAQMLATFPRIRLVAVEN